MTEQKALTPFGQLKEEFNKVLLPRLNDALVGVNHTSALRIMNVALSEIGNNQRLLDCDKASLGKAVMTCAKLGLEPNGMLGQAYLIPYGKVCQVIPGYKGYISLAHNSGEIKTIEACEIRENDKFTYEMGSKTTLRHKTTNDKGLPMSLKERGDIVGVWAMAKLRNGGTQFVVMPRDEVEEIRNKSANWKSALKKATRDNEGNITNMESAWWNHEGEMFKKTAIRRLCKALPFSVTKIHAAAALDDIADMGEVGTLNDDGSIIIEGTSEHVDAPVPVDSSSLDAFAERHAQPVDVDVTPFINVNMKAGGIPDYAEWLDRFTKCFVGLLNPEARQSLWDDHGLVIDNIMKSDIALGSKLEELKGIFNA